MLHIEAPANHPLMDTFVATHGAVVDSPSRFARQRIRSHARDHWALDIDPDAVCLTSLLYNPAPGPSPYPATVQHALTMTEALLHKVRRRSRLAQWFNAVQPWTATGLALRPVEKLMPNFTVR